MRRRDWELFNGNLLEVELEGVHIIEGLKYMKIVAVSYCIESQDSMAYFDLKNVPVGGPML